MAGRKPNTGQKYTNVACRGRFEGDNRCDLAILNHSPPFPDHRYPCARPWAAWWAVGRARGYFCDGMGFFFPFRRRLFEVAEGEAEACCASFRPPVSGADAVRYSKLLASTLSMRGEK